MKNKIILDTLVASEKEAGAYLMGLKNVAVRFGFKQGTFGKRLIIEQNER